MLFTVRYFSFFMQTVAAVEGVPPALGSLARHHLAAAGVVQAADGAEVHARLQGLSLRPGEQVTLFASQPGIVSTTSKRTLKG